MGPNKFNRGPIEPGHWRKSRSSCERLEVEEGAFGLDINGAALKERLSLNRRGEAAPAPLDVEIGEDAPPVYHWTGIPQATSKTAAAEEETTTSNTSLFRRLGLSFR
jgi:hypothetical protein